MTEESKKKELETKTDFIEFVPAEELATSSEFIGKDEKLVEPAGVETLAPDTRLEEMPPAFRELALPKLPELANENRARLQMQTPNRLFFYWSVGSNPFHKLNKALGAQTANYTLVLKLVDLRSEAEQIIPIDSEGSSWFDVEADSQYRAEIGFYAPNRPYVRALFSNVVETPRKSPSPRIDTEADWAVSADRFARVLEVAGFTEDAFDVALAGDDIESAESATHTAFVEFIDDETVNVQSIAADEIRHVLYLLASGSSIESLRGKISPGLFEILVSHSSSVTSESAMTVLTERFDVEGDEMASEEFGAAVFGSSLVNFPRRLRTKRTLPKFRPVSSQFGVPPSSGVS